MNLECLTDIITTNLAIHIDLTDVLSWDLNTGLSGTSLTQWSGAKSDKINLYDFGLTAFDNGRTDKLYNNLNVTADDLKVNLHRVGYNDATGGTFYDLYPMSSVTTASTVGNYFDLSGGYLQGYFKLEDYDFEQFPKRYNDGITIETLIKIDSFQDGIFLLMGARSEDKYNEHFSGETDIDFTIVETEIRTGIIGQSSTLVNVETGFTGVFTSEDNNLHAYRDIETKKMAFQQPELSTEDIPNIYAKDSINENVIAFSTQSDGSLAIKRVDDKGNAYTQVSTNKIPTTGWTFITIVFTPEERIDDPELFECAPARNGILRLFINGRQFWKIKDYTEFFFRGIKNTKEKQIGVPYNISWGGGSYGLKHSWHYDLESYSVYSGDNTTFIQNNFNVIENPLKVDPCDDIIDIADPNIGNVGYSANTTSFTDLDSCGDVITVTAMTVTYTGTTGESVGNQYLVVLTGLTNVISNRDYDITLGFFDTGIFSGKTNSAQILVYGDKVFETISEKTYVGNSIGSWIGLSLKTRVEDNTGLQTMNIGFLLTSDKPLKKGFQFHIKDWGYTARDVLSQDQTKTGLTIQENFNSSFVGGIQKLRLYDVAFDNQMVLHNAQIESNKQSYGFNVTGGGRLIYN